MEVNRDEAERCIEIAIRALEDAQPEKARRFLEKAQRLFPTRRAQGERTEPGLIQACRLCEAEEIIFCRNNYFLHCDVFIKRKISLLCNPEAPNKDMTVFLSGNVHMYSNGRMRFNQNHGERGEHRGGGLALLMQLMPILILVIVSALSQMMVTNPPYSLSFRPSAGHTHKRVTENLGVTYYVNERFSQDFSSASLKRVESSVEDDYISNLRNNCWKEKQQKEGLLYRARYFGDSDLYQRAQRMGTPSCSRLSEVQASLHG
uniref:DnaJ homolog subfamily B member 12-like n=1 Tax=Sinocyclocheilus grahami TaxID=75366 RepID=A0A672PPP2_SINGR